MNFRRPNDLIFHPNDDLYFTDPENYTRETPNGRVYRVAAGTQTAILVADELGFPNGLAFSADGKILYLNESAFERVLMFDVNPD
jgi:gluconolactonase